MAAPGVQRRRAGRQWVPDREEVPDDWKATGTDTGRIVRGDPHSSVRSECLRGEPLDERNSIDPKSALFVPSGGSVPPPNQAPRSRDASAALGF